METPSSFDQTSDNCGIQIPTSEENNNNNNNNSGGSSSNDDNNNKVEESSSTMKNKTPMPLRAQKAPVKSLVSKNLDRAIQHHLIYGRKLRPNLDARTLRRTISNRVSAQKARVKRSQHQAGMEKKARDLEVYVASMRPIIESYKERNRLLELENGYLRMKVDLRAAESKISEDGLKMKQRELMELQEQLNQRIMNSISTSTSNQEPHNSLEFYQDPELIRMEINQFIDQELNRSPVGAPPEPKPETNSETNIEDEIEQVDQYLNLEEDVMINIDDLL